MMEKLGRNVLRRVKKDISLTKKDLWAADRTRNFIERMVVMTLHKDLKGLSYHALKREFDRVFKLSVKAYHHNVYAVREGLRRWSKTVLTAPTLERLRSLARGQAETDSF